MPEPTASRPPLFAGPPGPARRRALALLVALPLLTACADSARQPTTPEPTPAAILARRGEGQFGTPGKALSDPLVAVVVDAAGKPLPGAVVRWNVSDGGAVSPVQSVTNASGEALTVWTLGGTMPHRAFASAGANLSVSFAAVADEEPPPGSDTPIVMNVVTYEGSGQAVHPDFAAVPIGWGTGPRQLAMTPYPNGNTAFENPSMFVARDDDLHWQIPNGGANPVARPAAGGYLSDPDIVFDPAANELRLYYRAVDDANHVLLLTSRDGTRWSAPVEVLTGPNQTLVSPSVVRRSDDEWLMWTVDGGAIGCQSPNAAVDLRRSSDGVHWSAPTRVQLDQPGFFPWHIDVQWIPALHEYWALFNVKRAGSCTTPALFFARSRDGVTWTTYPAPVLARGAIPEFADVVYRTTFAYDPGADAVTLWYSGARYEASPVGQYTWQVAVEHRSRAAFLARVTALGMGAAGVPQPRPGVPPLVDAP